MWPREREQRLCCKDGEYVLGDALNPPFNDFYPDLLKRAGVSRDSRVLNNALAMGIISTSPSKNVGGQGFVETGRGGPGAVALHDTMACAAAASLINCQVLEWLIAVKRCH